MITMRFYALLRAFSTGGSCRAIITRLLGATLAIAFGLSVLPAHAQTTQFTCEDFITQASAQASLERMPDDPYGLDPDGDGIACEDMVTGGGEIASLGSADPAIIGPAEYEVVEQEFQQMARPRVVMRIAVQEADDEETAAALAEAIADGLNSEPDAMVAHVFAYLEGDDTDGGYTVGIAQGSRDGLGWTGDGELGLQFGAEDEQGTVTVLLDSAISDLEERRFALPLELDASDVSGSGAEREQAAAVSPEEGAYANEVGEQMTLLGESMETFSELMAAPRMGQDDWTIQLAAVIVTWRTVEDEAEAMAPPATLVDVHDSYLKALGYLNAAGDDIVAGLDTGDAQLLNRAALNLELATAELATTQDMINSILEERGIR
jgi:hypothetical protein